MNTNLLADAVQLAKAMAHPTRLRILALLHHGPLPVCQITCVLHAVASTVSGHLLDLRHSGVAAEQRRGKFVYYRLSDNAEKDAVLDAMFASLSADPQVRQDAALGASIRAVSPLIVCDGRSHNTLAEPSRHP
jgi:DNA-binding transcriptional ArsR family regulator